MSTEVSRHTIAILHTHVYYNIAKLWNQPRCPSMDEWIKKMCYVYTLEFYITGKKNELIYLLENGWY
jgi:hypothetical protein